MPGVRQRPCTPGPQLLPQPPPAPTAAAAASGPARPAARLPPRCGPGYRGAGERGKEFGCCFFGLAFCLVWGFFVWFCWVFLNRHEPFLTLPGIREKQKRNCCGCTLRTGSERLGPALAGGRAGRQPERRQPAERKSPPERHRSAPGRRRGPAGNARAGSAGAGGSPRRRWVERDPRAAPERAGGRAGSASPRALPPPQASACEPPLARPHGRSLSPLPDQSHYSHVAHGPGGAATRAGRCVTAAKRSGEGARPSRPPWAAHAAGASVATATAWPPPLSGPSSRGRPGDCLSGREARRAAAAPGRGGPRLPRPCRPAGAAEAGGGRAGGRAGGGARTRRQRAGRLWRAGQGRAAALVGPGGPPAAAVAAGGVRRRGVAPAFLPPAPARLFPLAYCEGQRTCSERSLCREGGRPVPSPLGRLPGTRWGVVAARFHRGPGQGGRQGPL